MGSGTVAFEVVVWVKGGEERSLPLGFKAAQALARELASKNKAPVQVRRVVV